MTIQDNLNRIQQAKSDIKAAIESKGVYVDDADKIDIYASKIYEIEQGGGTGVMDIYDAGQLYDMIMNQGYAGPTILKGTITGIDDISPEYNNATYYVDDTIKVYRGNYLEGMSFVNGDELKIGDYVVVRGTVSNYNGTPQMDKYSFIEVLKHEPLLGHLNADFNDLLDGSCWWYPHEHGFDGFNYVSINANAYGEQKYNQGFVDGQNAGGGGTGVINMADRGLRFFHFNGENFDGYDFSTVTDFTRFFSWLPQLRSDINITFNTAQNMDYMFEFVASDIEEGIEINIDFNNNICVNFSNVFEGSRLKRFPRFTNMNDETWIENYRPLGNCHIHNFDNWQDFPWNKLRGEGGNSLFANMDNLVEVPAIDLSNVEVANGMFGDCYNLERIESLNLQNIGAFSWVFSGCEKLTYIGDLGNFENCWQFDNPFEGCPNLITLPRMHNLKKNLNLSNMVQMDAGVAGLFLANDVYNFTENGNKQDGEGVLTVPAYFNDDEFWNIHKNTIESKGWTIEYV